ncbi:hypothetical protein Gdia_2309 [Gluconacetobacter diazotrophicus PA1 5]|nr:hypothetical protein Gdia_2309 [Gluconacetobacter diazotrophicus PA1 5]
MYSSLRLGPPKVTFEQRSGRRIRPISLPAGLWQNTLANPSGAVCPGSGKLDTTYSVRRSGEKHRPLGLGTSVCDRTASTAPVFASTRNVWSGWRAWAANWVTISDPRVQRIFPPDRDPSPSVPPRAPPGGITCVALRPAEAAPVARRYAHRHNLHQDSPYG